MVSDVGDSEGCAGHPFTGVEVRAQLIKYWADSLRDVPGEGRTFVYLGRVLVGTEWSRWMQHVQPVTQSSARSAFRFAYKFHPAGVTPSPGARPQHRPPRAGRRTARNRDRQAFD